MGDSFKNFRLMLAPAIGLAAAPVGTPGASVLGTRPVARKSKGTAGNARRLQKRAHHRAKMANIRRARA
jgi:hypothetical protein